MSSLCLCIAALFPCFQLTFGTVHQLYSSLEITDRAHGCREEILTLTCNATGTVVRWNFPNNIILQFTNMTENINIIQREGDYITAFLIGIIGTGEVSERNFLSVVFINITEAEQKNTLPGNITCSSDSHSDTFFGSIADVPQPPHIQDSMTCLGATNVSAQYIIQWTEPSNIDWFDLDHYELTVGKDIIGIDARENMTIISVIPETNITLKISAIDRCRRESESSSGNYRISTTT